MKINWSAFVTNPVYQIGGVVGVLALVSLFACGQESCGKKYVETAKVEAVKADDAHEQLKGALNEIVNLRREKNDAIEAAKRYRALYVSAQAKVPPPPVVVPPAGGERERELVAGGFQTGLAVDPTASVSVLTESDSGLAYLLSQRAKRAAALEEALKACDDLQAQQDAAFKAQALELAKTNDALRASMDEAIHRQTQATELGKALTNEKRKAWQRWALAAGGVVVGYAAAKH